MLPGVDLEQMLLTVGYVGLAAIIFAESGLFFGFFLPGDTLLITAGVLASARPDVFSIEIVIFVCFIAAVTAMPSATAFGKRVGGRLYDRPDSRWFKKKHLAAAEAFYERHGGKTIVMARFLPFVRTFAPIVAGTAQMRYPRFAVFNFTGALLWAVGLAGRRLRARRGDGRAARPLAPRRPRRRLHAVDPADRHPPVPPQPRRGPRSRPLAGPPRRRAATRRSTSADVAARPDPGLPPAE